MTVLKNVSCILRDTTVICNGVEYHKETIINYENEWFWIYLAIYVALVIVAGVVSGLTMGLLSLDIMSLTILSTDGKPKEQKYAKRILPLVKRHHLLLVTLLLTNAAAVESMPLFLDKISNPLTAIIVSVTAVLIFGEVVPQALCTRFGLAIGATFSPLVYFLMVITFPISWPLSKLLDCLLGTDHSTFFRRAELKALVDLHQDPDHSNEEPLTEDEVLIIKGALSMRDKTVKQICTSVNEVFCLDINGVMNRDTMDLLLAKGRSRVPIYNNVEQTYVGLILVKNLIKIDPDDNIPIREIFDKNRRPLLKVSEHTQLYDALNMFQVGRSHMFVVVKHNEGDDTKMTTLLTEHDTVIGIVTLEDVIEELIQEEIEDETDIPVAIHNKIKTVKLRASRLSLSSSYPGTTAHSDKNGELTQPPGVDDDTQPLLP